MVNPGSFDLVKDKKKVNWQFLVEEAKLRRLGQKITQETLAKLAGVSTPTLVRFEKGKRNIKVSSVFKILDMLGLKLNDQPKEVKKFELRCVRKPETALYQTKNRMDLFDEAPLPCPACRYPYEVSNSMVESQSDVDGSIPS